MSWDADLVECCITCGHEERHGSWNYTHNCNQMISAVVEEMGYELKTHWLIGHMGKSWFEVLDNMSGKDGAKFLREIVMRLEAHPERFSAMNPPNGWGSYETLLPLLHAMKTASYKNPGASWRVSG